MPADSVCRFFVFRSVGPSRNLKIRYEDIYVEIPVNPEECPYDQEWFEENINKPEYNIWHRETRHLDNSYIGQSEEAQYKWDQVAGDAPSLEEMVSNKILEEDIHAWIDQVLDEYEKDLFLSVAYDRVCTTQEYAAMHDLKAATVRKRLERVRTKMKKAVTQSPFSWLTSEEVSK